MVALSGKRINIQPKVVRLNTTKLISEFWDYNNDEDGFLVKDLLLDKNLDKFEYQKVENGV